MRDFIDTEIKHLDVRLGQAQTLLDVAISKDRYSKIEPLGAKISALHDTRFLLVSTKGLDVHLVLLDALVRATKELLKRPLTTFDRVYIVEISRLLQRYQWHLDLGGGKVATMKRGDDI